MDSKDGIFNNSPYRASVHARTDAGREAPISRSCYSSDAPPPLLRILAVFGSLREGRSLIASRDVFNILKPRLCIHFAGNDFIIAY